jgi:osmotically-inducible protein OsmY
MSDKSDPTSDERLYKTILACFAADGRTESASLRVGVLNGIVHLAGEVASPEMRIFAAELAGGLPGVRGVVNRIQAPGAPPPARTVNLDLHGK